jgi:quercetin dioxygenase-like cupin family protein
MNGRQGHRIDGRGSEIGVFLLETLEGQPNRGRISCRKRLHGRNALLVEMHVARGTSAPYHHHTHESYLYVVSDVVRTVLAGEAHTLGPGDAMLHPAGVDHLCEVLEDAVWVEVKTPPEEPW